MSIHIRSRQTIHTQGNIHFISKEIQLPDGSTRHKAMIDHPGAVAIVPLTDDGQVVLLRQYRLALEADLLEIPAGTLEPDEDPHTAAARELQEEAGYYPETLIELGSFYVAPGLSNERMYLFLARDLRPSRLSMDDDEIIHVLHLPYEEALTRITTNEIQDAKTIIGLLQAIPRR